MAPKLMGLLPLELVEVGPIMPMQMLLETVDWICFFGTNSEADYLLEAALFTTGLAGLGLFTLRLERIERFDARGPDQIRWPGEEPRPWEKT